MDKLDEEEKEILDAYETGKASKVKDSQALLERHRAYARATMKRDARITVRLPVKDLRALQKRAVAEGISYHALVSSVLHKYVEGRLRETE